MLVQFQQNETDEFCKNVFPIKKRKTRTERTRFAPDGAAIDVPYISSSNIS